MRALPRYAIAGIAGAAITAVASLGRTTPYDNYTLLAQAFLEGHVWIHWPGPYIDALAYNGLYYIIEAPLPAILMLPLVLLHVTDQTLLSIVMTGVALGAAWELGERYHLPTRTNAWISGFFLLGTDLLFCGMFGDVWFIAHVCAVSFTLLALVELAGKRRAWLVMLWGACAFESRFSLVLAVPVYAFLLLSDGTPRERVRCAGSMLAVLVPVALLWMLYNEARWGTVTDIGYTTWYHQDAAGSPTGSPFRLFYLPFELWSFFAQRPAVTSAYPWLVPSLSGVALTWTSPALVLSLLARRPVRVVASLWIATLLVAAPSFLYYVNGFSQFGMRHALDFEPFLIALMMLGVRERMPAWGVLLVVYSSLVGLWGCWYWQTFVR